MQANVDDFKRAIDLRAYAKTLGYLVDKHDSWRGECVMRRGEDKISISVNRQTGHWIYYSFRDALDHGTVMDFALRRRGGGFGQILRELAVFLDGTSPSDGEVFELQRLPKDFGKVRRVWHMLAPVPPHPFLEGERKIPSEILLSDRFHGCVRGESRYRNAAFPHYSVDGDICGIEFKGPGSTRFIAGGRKTVWVSNRFPTDESLVICESAVECLSYAALFPEQGKFRYVSTAGSVSPQLPELRQVMSEMPFEADIVGAMNPDAAGILWNKTLQTVFEEIGREDLNWRVHYPQNGEDWNDELKRSVK